jgi:ParB-like chromosome segregation protein Spo0J
MKTIKAKIKDIKTNPNNPRYIKDEKFNKLVQSIKELPEMLQLRPIVVNEEMVVLGGNMRLKACQKAGLKEVPIIKASDLTPEQQEEFIIKDNVGFGSWDWDILANEWDAEKLDDWGMDVWQQAEDVDYSILDDEDMEDQLNDFTNGVKKAIQIEFNSEDYEKAYNLIKYFREQKKYIGGMIIKHLEEDKRKI